MNVAEGGPEVNDDRGSREVIGSAVLIPLVPSDNNGTTF